MALRNETFEQAWPVWIAYDGGTYDTGLLDNVDYTDDPAYDPYANKGAWWSYTPAASGSATFDTQQSTSLGWGTDTYLRLFTVAGGVLTEVAADDESGGSNTSLLTFGVTAGTAYAVLVSAYSSDRMNYRLRVVGPASSPAVPPHNLRAQAYVAQVPAGGTAGQWYYAPPTPNAALTVVQNGTDDLVAPLAVADPYTRSAWYRYTPAVPGAEVSVFPYKATGAGVAEYACYVVTAGGVWIKEYEGEFAGITVAGTHVWVVIFSRDNTAATYGLRFVGPETTVELPSPDIAGALVVPVQFGTPLLTDAGDLPPAALVMPIGFGLPSLTYAPVELAVPAAVGVGAAPAPALVDATVELVSPPAAATVPATLPAFVVSVDTAASAAIVEVEYADDDTFTTATAVTAPAAPGLADAQLLVQTSVPLADGLWWWRARVTVGGVAGDWTAARAFAVNAIDGGAILAGTWTVNPAATADVHVWFLHPDSGDAPGEPVTLVGAGFGGSPQVFYGDVLCTAVSDAAVAAGPDAYTAARSIDPTGGTAEPGHDTVTVLIPDTGDDASVGDALTVQRGA